MPLSILRKLALVVLVLVITACSGPEKKIVGKWQNVQLSETVEFLDNNNGIFEVKDKPSLGFKWKLINKNQVRLEFKIGNETKFLTGTVDKDVFTLKGDSQQVIYKKIK